MPYVRRRNPLPEWAEAGSLMTCCVALFDSLHLLIVPDSKSSLNTVAADTAVTVTFAEPLTPPLVAVLDVVPAATAVTTPEPDTVANAVFPLAHVTVRPVRTLLLASRSVTAACTLAPAATVPPGMVTATEATGTRATVTDALPVRPSLVAVMFVVPEPTAVTSPLAVTVAIAVLPLAQVTTRPLRM